MRFVIYITLLILPLNNGETYDHHRLPTNVRPEYYKLKILTHFDDADDFSFNGEVTILLNTYEESQNVTLHAKNLTIDSSKVALHIVDDGNDLDGNVPISKTEVIAKHDYYVVHTVDKLMPQKKYKLFIPFSSKLNKGLFGYYRSSYVDKRTNKKEWLSVSQFEPIYGRMGFPCFDEPEMKAKFKVLLGHHKKYIALSNMPLESTIEIDYRPDWVLDEFEETVPMPTYLVAYTVNSMINKESTLKENNVLFRTWARSDAISQVDYASVVGPKVLKFYEELFDIKFPLPKMDQIAIPDFGPGAMENWGLVTYRENSLLYAPNISSSSNKHRIATVIAHELAHQWFGNLVTMKWWTDIWLNEGFATYIASLGVEHLHPEWSSLAEDSIDRALGLFKFDALKSSHPVSVPITHANEISEIFDDISYSKGASVIRMMHLFLGEESFRRGVTNYLKKHAYGNAEQDNLWESLTEVAHTLRVIPNQFTVKKVMDSWTLQTGYPIVTIIRDYSTSSAAITQSRYLLDTYAGRNEEENCWWIPLSSTTQSESNFNNTHPKIWLECNDTEVVPITVENIAKSNEWIIFNIQLSGFYKVKYDDKNWDLLIDTLMSPDYIKIHPINRAQLIDDALDLAWTGDQDYSIAIRLIDYLQQEVEYIPWKSALSNLNSVNRMLRLTPEYEYFKKYMRRILQPIYKTLGGLNSEVPASERLDSAKHRILIAGWACRFDVGDCVEKSQNYFKKWKSTENPDVNNPIPVDFRSVIYCNAIRHGNDEDWDFLWKRFLNSNVAAEQITMLSSLGCAREIWVLQRFLEWSLVEKSGVRKQDIYTVFTNIARGEIGFGLAKNFFVKNVEKIYKHLLPDSSKMTRFIRPLAAQMNSNADYELMKTLTQKNKKFFEKSRQGVKRALETIEINSQWKARNYNEFAKQLQKLVN